MMVNYAKQDPPVIGKPYLYREAAVSLKLFGLKAYY